MDRKERTIFVTIIVNSLLIGFKFWLGAVSGSQALQASAVHSVTDATIGIFVLLGLFIKRWDASRPVVKQRFGRIENWIALLVSAAIFYVAYDIVMEVLSGEPPELRNLGPITIASLITVVIAFFIARYKLYVGRQTNSPALLASGAHSQMDIYAAIVVVVGLAGSALGLPNLDRTAAAIVVVFIAFSGFEIASSAISALRRHEVLEIDEEANNHQHMHGTHRLWHAFLPIGAVLLIGVYLASGFYIVSPGEIAVVRRFGEVIVPNEQAGLHYRLPWPVDRVDIVSVNSIRRTEPAASLMLTGDQNLVSIRISLHYVVNDAAAFLLNVTDSDLLTSRVAEASIRQVIAQETVDSLLTVDKSRIEQQVAVFAQSALDNSNAGLRVVGVQLLESNPPMDVADAFRDIASAREDQNTFINEARAYANEILPVARGNAATTVQAANAYFAQKIGQAQGDAALFTDQQEAYAQFPLITRARMYLVAVENVLPGVRKFILDPGVQIATTDLWFSNGSSVQTLPPLP